MTKYFAIFKSDGELLSYAHQGYEDLRLPIYQNYTGLVVKEIPEIPSGIYNVRLEGNEIVKTIKDKYK